MIAPNSRADCHGKPASSGGVSMSVTFCASPTERTTTLPFAATVIAQGVS